ncbi:hypothetical protein [Paenibacillus sp. MMS18-CY102]|uniref:hypothetical protein n=1 Tax=Paenibacillus sp. MMS18-CY102 TaxID=2682849 RepID=UPI001923A59D|nr:hypothetical protein [Paenibacillus sp. MMS18-CY102]
MSAKMSNNRKEQRIQLVMDAAKKVFTDMRFPLLLQDFCHGLRYIISNRLLLALIAGFLFFGIVNGVFAVLPIFAMKYKLSPEHYVFHSSLLTVCLGTGFLIGSIVAPFLIRRFTRTPINIALGSWIPELVPSQHIGRANALIEPVMMLGYSLALGLIAVAFPHWISISWLHFILGLCTAAVSAYYWSTLPALVRHRSELGQSVSGP